MNQLTYTVLLLLCLSPVAQADILEYLPERPVYSAEQAEEDAAKNCQELYQEIRVLYAQSYTGGKTYWENPVNYSLGIAGTMFAPAYYGLLYTRGWGFKQQYDQEMQRERLNQLRYHAARLRCFSG